MDHQKDNLIAKVIPFFKPRNKKVIQLRVDQQRNLLYSLGRVEVKGHSLSVIDVFDLGCFGDEFSQKLTIEMWELVSSMDKHNRQDEKHWKTRFKSKYEWAHYNNVVDL